ncbi:MAG: hypothetical protein EBS92_02030 [Proteobacteria bacterium]|nr:hypothetical protein [Pseudomonadota bacterium]
MKNYLLKKPSNNSLEFLLILFLKKQFHFFNYKISDIIKKIFSDKPESNLQMKFYVKLYQILEQNEV